MVEATTTVPTSQVTLHGYTFGLEKVPCGFCGGTDFFPFWERMRHGLNLPTVFCKRCGLCMTNPRPTADANTLFYSKLYNKFHKREGPLDVDSPYVRKSRRLAVRRVECLAQFVDLGGLVVMELSVGVRAVVAQIEDGAGPTSLEIDMTAARIRLDEGNGQLEIVERDLSVKPGPNQGPKRQYIPPPEQIPGKPDMIRGCLSDLISEAPLACRRSSFARSRSWSVGQPAARRRIAAPSRPERYYLSRVQDHGPANGFSGGVFFDLRHRIGTNVAPIATSEGIAIDGCSFHRGLGVSPETERSMNRSTRPSCGRWHRRSAVRFAMRRRRNESPGAPIIVLRWAP